MEVILLGDEMLMFSCDEVGCEVFWYSNWGFVCEQGWNVVSQFVIQCVGFFLEEIIWGGLFFLLVWEYCYDSVGNVLVVISWEDYGWEIWWEYWLDWNGQVMVVIVLGIGLGYGEGDEFYGYDSCGYLKVQFVGRYWISEEIEWYVGGYWLKQVGNMQYDYDVVGWMVSWIKYCDGYCLEIEWFWWDSWDQLIGYCSVQGEQWEYCYDVSGR